MMYDLEAVTRLCKKCNKNDCIYYSDYFNKTRAYKVIWFKDGHAVCDKFIKIQKLVEIDQSEVLF